MWRHAEVARWADPASTCGAYALGTRIRVGQVEVGKFRAQRREARPAGWGTSGEMVGTIRAKCENAFWGAEVQGRQLAPEGMSFQVGALRH